MVVGDVVVHAKGFGVKHLETREPVTATSLFHLASVSKPFVATAIMQLAEQGKLDLDTPLERYLRRLGNASLLFAPGERFAYSNIAYEVLGDLIAKLSGHSFEEYMRRQLLRPLGMSTSTFLKHEVPAELGVTPHV